METKREQVRVSFCYYPQQHRIIEWFSILWYKKIARKAYLLLLTTYCKILMLPAVLGYVRERFHHFPRYLPPRSHSCSLSSCPEGCSFPPAPPLFLQQPGACGNWWFSALLLLQWARLSSILWQTGKIKVILIIIDDYNYCLVSKEFFGLAEAGGRPFFGWV